MATTRKSAKSSTPADESAAGFTDIERTAIKERAQELRTTKQGRGKAADESAVLAKIAEMPQPDRGMAERVHAVVTANGPDLSPKLWYGMPGYAKGGKVICFFQSPQKFKTRYATLGFNEEANLDDGEMWPTAYALTEMTEAVEKKIAALVTKAVG